jgi:hypothetical protein
VACHPAICHRHQVTFAASVHSDSADNLSRDHGGASCASEIDSYRIGMLGCVWSDLASKILMTFSRKCPLQVHLNPGADISAITVRLLRWDFLRTLRRLSTRNKWKHRCSPQHSRSICIRAASQLDTLWIFCRANPFRRKNARAAGLKANSLYFRADGNCRALGRVSWGRYIPCSGQLSKRSDISSH